MKFFYILFCTLVAGCNCDETSDPVKKSKIFATNDGYTYNEVCIDRVVYLQQRTNGNLTPKFRWNSNTPETCENKNLDGGDK